MNISKISPRFYVSEQISGHDVGAVAAHGITTIICIRPDNEAQGQALEGEVAAAAEGLGITFVDMPVKAGSITDENIADFERALNHFWIGRISKLTVLMQVRNITAFHKFIL